MRFHPTWNSNFATFTRSTLYLLNCKSCLQYWVAKRNADLWLVNTHSLGYFLVLIWTFSRAQDDQGHINNLLWYVYINFALLCVDRLKNDFHSLIQTSSFHTVSVIINTLKGLGHNTPNRSLYLKQLQLYIRTHIHKLVAYWYTYMDCGWYTYHMLSFADKLVQLHVIIIMLRTNTVTLPAITSAAFIQLRMRLLQTYTVP